MAASSQPSPSAHRPNREALLAGWSMVVGGAPFWLSWYLMPQPGTTDAAFILAAVARQRSAVFRSAVLQTWVYGSHGSPRAACRPACASAGRAVAVCQGRPWSWSGCRPRTSGC